MWIRHKNPNANKRGEIKTMLGNAVPRLKPAKPTKPTNPTKTEPEEVLIWIGGLQSVKLPESQTPQGASDGIATDVATSFPRSGKPVTFSTIDRAFGSNSFLKSRAPSKVSTVRSKKSMRAPAINDEKSDPLHAQQSRREERAHQRNATADRLLQGPSSVSIISNAVDHHSLGLVAQDCFGNQWWVVDRDRNDIIWALKDWDVETQGRNNPWAVKHVTMHGLTHDKERVWIRVRDSHGFWQHLNLDSIPCDEQLRSLYWNQYPIGCGM